MGYKLDWITTNSAMTRFAQLLGLPYYKVTCGKKPMCLIRNLDVTFVEALMNVKPLFPDCFVVLPIAKQAM